MVTYWQPLVRLGPLIPPRVPNGQCDRGRQPMAWTLVVAWCSGLPSVGIHWWLQTMQDTFWASTGLQPVQARLKKSQPGAQAVL